MRWRTGFEAALDVLESLGCRLVEIPFGDFYATANLLYEGAWVAERYAAIRDFMDANEGSLHPVTRQDHRRREETVGGRRVQGALRTAGVTRRSSRRSSPRSICSACRPRRRITALEAVFADPIATNSRLGTYTNFVNLLDMCGIAVPAGKRSDGLPMSVTLLAPAGKDHLTAALARDIHAASGSRSARPAGRGPAPHCPQALRQTR